MRANPPTPNSICLAFGIVAAFLLTWDDTAATVMAQSRGGRPGVAPQGGPAIAPQPVERPGGALEMQPRGVLTPPARPLPLRQVQASGPETGAPASLPNLATSEDLERLLEKAVKVSRERPELSPVLWQRVFDEGATVFARRQDSGESVPRREYAVYRPFSETSLRSLVDAGAEALRHYRLQMDGPARILFADRTSTREASLQEIARRYLLTTIGDEAVFELGCLALERGDFVSANHLFEQLAFYPDSSIAADAVRARLAYARAQVGRLSMARQQLASITDVSVKDALTAALDRQEKSASPPADALQSPDSGPLSGTAAVAWTYDVPWDLKGSKKSNQNQAIMAGMNNGRPTIFIRQPEGNYIQKNLDDRDIPALSRDELMLQWRNAGWHPAARPVVSGNRVFLKSERRTVCCDLTTGEVAWMGRPTRYPIDSSSQQLALVAAHGLNVTYPAAFEIRGPRPRTLTEIQLFGDRLFHAVTVSQGQVYAVEGEIEAPSQRPDAPVPAGGRNVEESVTRERVTELACYDERTGRLLWSFPPPGTPDDRGSCISVPLPIDKQVVVAVQAAGQLGLQCLSSTTGAPVWKSSLCEWNDRSAPMIPVGVTADEGSLYVLNGAGSLFCVDRVNGALRWAVTYPRLQSPGSSSSAAGAARQSRIQFAQEDNFLMLTRGTIVCSPADSDHVMAFDLTDGRLQWDSPLPEAAIIGRPCHVAGTDGSKLIMVADSLLWSIQLSGGRIAWEQAIPASAGRAAVIGSEVIVPAPASLVVHRATSGERLREISVSDPALIPPGNVVWTGERLLLAGPARLMAVGPARASESKATPSSSTRPSGGAP